eukprot:m.22301 g.22301  ORF g.22301 m.22301 type:complete len:420 (+) comp28318_c0_seq4:2921-4180(+)
MPVKRTDSPLSPEDGKKTLTFDEVRRLDSVLHEKYEIHGIGHFPTLEVNPYDFAVLLKTRLQKNGFEMISIRLNGSAASYVVKQSDTKDYNDLDLLFHVELTSEVDFQKIREVVLSCLIDFMPVGVCTERLGAATLEDAYVDKMVKVFTEQDRWSLISLRNECGRNLEVKFVGEMRRPYQFSVDSLQIVVDSYLAYASSIAGPLSSNFYPSVIVQSMYGNVAEAVEHLDQKVIATKCPEEIRGGGLLKYCSLAVQGYRPTEECRRLERYMCSRFFIDFPEAVEIHAQLISYLGSHFSSNPGLQHDFLMTLHDVVNSSTVCLMSFERRQALQLIRYMARKKRPLPSPSSHPPRQVRPGGRPKQTHHHQCSGPYDRRQQRQSRSCTFVYSSPSFLPMVSPEDGSLVWLVPVEAQPVYNIDF